VRKDTGTGLGSEGDSDLAWMFSGNREFRCLFIFSRVLRRTYQQEISPASRTPVMVPLIYTAALLKKREIGTCFLFNGQQLAERRTHYCLRKSAQPIYSSSEMASSISILGLIWLGESMQLSVQV
jgi:hypothetical protein